MQWGGQAACLQLGVHGGEGFGTGVLQRVGPSLMQSCLPQPTAPRGQTRWYKVSSALLGLAVSRGGASASQGYALAHGMGECAAPP